MSFAGDLEHLPVVDIIQLLHSTRRSGTLHLMGPSGESRLAFSDGYIVSSNHRNNSVRLGQVLVGMNALSQTDLDAALAAQQETAAAERPPLIALLLESGKIDRNTGQRALETLIVMTIIDVLTWPGGTFSLDVDSVAIADEYRYFPEKLQQEFYVGTQNVLMDALRIYDEKQRDGELDGSIFADEGDGDAGESDRPAAPHTASGVEISEDLLGLDELDRLDNKIPDVFRSLRLEDPADPHRRVVKAAVPTLPPVDQERLVEHLLKLAALPGSQRKGDGGKTVILFSRDTLLNHAVALLCKGCGWFSFNTDDEASLDLIIEQSLAKESEPLLFIDDPPGDDTVLAAERLSEMARRKRDAYPDLPILRILALRDETTQLAAIGDGALAVLAKPDRRQPVDYVEVLIALLAAMRSWIERSDAVAATPLVAEAIELHRRISELTSPPEVSLLLAGFVARAMERSLTLVVADQELIAERGFGIRQPKDGGPTPPLKFRLQAADSPLLREVIERGRCYWGNSNDRSLAGLHTEISAPRSNRVLLLPLRLNQRTIAVIYGDFGERPLGKGHRPLAEMLAHHAGTVLENALSRKQRPA